MIDFDDIDFLFGEVGDGFICSPYRATFSRIDIGIGHDVHIFSDDVHSMIELLRIGNLKYRLSREACPDVLQRLKAVEYPLVCFR